MIGRFMFALTAASVALLVFATWRVLDQPLTTYVVNGELSAAERQTVRKVLSGVPATGILSADLEVVSDAVQEIPWAREVSIKRRWPDALEVTLHRAQPVARWGDTEYVSASGELLSLPDDYPGLPRFDVRQNTPQQAMEVYRLLDQISARESLPIERLMQNAQGEWTVQFADGLQVHLGAEQLNQRMHRFLLVYRRVLLSDDRVAAYVDARYANGVAVRYEDDEAADEMLVARNELAEGA